MDRVWARICGVRKGQRRGCARIRTFYGICLPLPKSPACCAADYLRLACQTSRGLRGLRRRPRLVGSLREQTFASSQGASGSCVSFARVSRIVLGGCHHPQGLSDAKPATNHARTFQYTEDHEKALKEECGQKSITVQGLSIFHVFLFCLPYIRVERVRSNEHDSIRSRYEPQVLSSGGNQYESLRTCRPLFQAFSTPAEPIQG
jgi:hypothetical protein